MNNIELEAQFKVISQLNNSLDAIVELKKLNKEYKKSDFYKMTKMSIYDAYKASLNFKLSKIIMRIHSFSNVEDLSLFINELINNIDEDTLNIFLEKLSNVLSMSEIEKYSKQLENSIEKLKIK